MIFSPFVFMVGFILNKFMMGPELVQGLGLRPPPKIFALYKKGPHLIVKNPKFYKKI